MSTIRAEGLDELRTNFGKAPQLAAPILKRGIESITSFVFKQATRANVPWDTGTMVQTFQQSTEGLVGRVNPTVEYALHVHEGTKFQKAQPFLPKMIAAAQPDINRVADAMGEKVAIAVAKQ